MFTIEQIIQDTSGKLTAGVARGLIRSISIDSRVIIKGQVFIAIKWDIFDGHDFIADVIAKGARVILVHKPVAVTNPNVIVIQVKDTVRALGHLARFHRLRFKTPVITITGSAGKTTTKEMIAAVLGRKFKVLKNEGTQNNHIGVPMTLLKLKPMHKIVVLECGTNQPGDIPWLAQVAQADMAVFTNVGESHLEKLKSAKGVLKEKWALTDCLKKSSVVIMNADDEYLSGQMKTAGRRFKLISYGIGAKASLQASRVTIEGGRALSFTAAGKRFFLNSCGVSNIYNALAAIACGQVFRVPTEESVRALKKFDFPQGRGQILRLGKGWLINDVYNANPVSMKAALQTLDAITIEGQKIFVAADMLELGGQAKALHQSIGAVVAKSTVGTIITVGALSRYIASSARKNNRDIHSFVCKDIDEAQKSLAQVFKNGDAVLVKGSRRMKMEQVVEFLLASPRATLT